MKKIAFCLLLLIITIVTFSQQIKSAPTLTKQDYFLKSKHQKTTAWVLLSSGIGLVISGGILNTHEIYDPSSWDRKYSTKGTPLVISGLLAMASSIPLFIASSKNKKKAMSLSLKNETFPQIYKSSFVYKPVPSLNLKINL